MIVSPDLINGSVELVGAGFLAMNIRQLLRDKMVRGFHWAPVSFFSSWALWSTYFYPSIGQWFSFAGAVVMATVNISYLLITLWYLKKNK